jgi:UDP-N-acetylmuramate dehydrogenase
MILENNKNLKKLNSFGVEAFASAFVEIKNNSDIQELIKILSNYENKLILGGGSNILFVSDYDGLVIKNKISGIEIISEDDESVLLKIGAGENWHNFVGYCVRNNYSGLENLALIPGTVGAAPVQNIGAYGVEQDSCFECLDAFDFLSGEIVKISKSECEFSYRDSIFKSSRKERYLITHIYYKLSKKDNIKINYKELSQKLFDKNINNPNPKDVFNSVIEIRKSKLPDPEVIGNAGSFFKNPVITKSQLDKLLEIYPDAKYFPFRNKFKISAGWLIERCGWKGKKAGNCGISEKHALILVNYGTASGAEIFDLSEEIIKSVKIKFNIDLKREVNIISR